MANPFKVGKENATKADPVDLQAVRGILLKHWDPLKAEGQETSPDKYDIYAQELVLAAQNNLKFDAIMVYVFLRHIELERFAGLKQEVERINVREKTAKAVVDYFQGKKQ